MNNIRFVTDIDNVVNDWVGGFSPFEVKMINKYSKPPILHLFSGMSEIGNIRIDINPNSRATIIEDVFEYIQDCSEVFNTILLDPIYCSEERQEIWKEKYSKLGIKKEQLYIFPYDTRKTRELWEFFERKYSLRIIIKSLNHYTIPNYKLLQGFDIYPGAFKPNRCLSIYQSKNKRLDAF